MPVSSSPPMRPIVSARGMHARAVPHFENVQHSFPSDDFTHASSSFVTYPPQSHISSPMFASLDGVASRMDTTHSFHPIAPFPRSPQPNISRSPTSFVAYSSTSRISSPSCASLAGVALHPESTRPVHPITPYTYSPPIVAHSFSSSASFPGAAVPFSVLPASVSSSSSIPRSTSSMSTAHSSSSSPSSTHSTSSSSSSSSHVSSSPRTSSSSSRTSSSSSHTSSSGSTSTFRPDDARPTAFTPTAPRPVSPESPQPKKRSHRCFVCGGTGQHRLNFRYCLRTWQLVSERLAKFNGDERLVSYDGTPLPMTRNPGGVAAHLFSLHRSPAHSNPVAPHSIHPIAPLSNRSFESNSPHVPLRSAEPLSHVSSPDRTFIANPPHAVPPSSRTIPPHFPTPFSSSPPVSEPRRIPKSRSNLSSQPKSHDSFILELFDCLIDSSSFRHDLLEVIGIINRKSTGISADPLGWWKIWDPVRDRIAAFATR